MVTLLGADVGTLNHQHCLQLGTACCRSGLVFMRLCNILDKLVPGLTGNVVSTVDGLRDGPRYRGSSPERSN